MERLKRREVGSDHGFHKFSQGEQRGEVFGGSGARSWRVRRDVPLHRSRHKGATSLQEHFKAEVKGCGGNRRCEARGGDNEALSEEFKHCELQGGM